MCGGAHMRGAGACMWSNTSVEERVGLSVGAAIRRGAYRRRNAVSYHSQ